MAESRPPYIVRSKLESFPIARYSVGEMLKQQMSRADPDRIALIDANSDRKLSYGQLEQQANEIACALLEVGGDVQPADIAMFYADDCIDYVTVYLALLYLGLTIAPTPPVNGPHETRQTLSDLNAKLLIVSRRQLTVIRQLMDNDGELIAKLRLLLILDDIESNKQLSSIEEHRNYPENVRTFRQLLQIGNGKLLRSIPHFPIENTETSPFLIIFTSGTTGLPKGAILSHRSFVASLSSVNKAESLRMDGWSFGMVYTFGHLAGSAYILIGLLQQLTGILFTKYSHQLYLRSIERYQIDWVPMLPGFCLELYQTDQTKHYNLSSIKLISYGGSKYARHWIDTVKERYKVPTIERYSSTEFFRSVTNLGGGDYPPGSVGSPVANVEMKIIDLDTGDSLPPNHEGEICLRGPNRFSGYLNNPKATAETIDSDGWYHSGDVGYYDTEDRLFITDRIKELIKYKHWSVAPSEIEAFLQTHPTVSVACVVGVPHQTEGSHLRAYVTLTGASGSATTDQQLIDYVKENMGYQKRLNGGVRFVDRIARSIVDKVDRTYFRNLVRNELLTIPADVD